MRDGIASEAQDHLNRDVNFSDGEKKSVLLMQEKWDNIIAAQRFTVPE